MTLGSCIVSVKWCVHVIDWKLDWVIFLFVRLLQNIDMMV